jgi:hypothetical protein
MNMVWILQSQILTQNLDIRIMRLPVILSTFFEIFYRTKGEKPHCIGELIFSFEVLYIMSYIGVE